MACSSHTRHGSHAGHSDEAHDGDQPRPILDYGTSAAAWARLGTKRCSYSRIRAVAWAPGASSQRVVPLRPPLDAKFRDHGIGPGRCGKRTGAWGSPLQAEFCLEGAFLQTGLHGAEEPRRVRAVDEPVVVGER